MRTSPAATSYLRASKPVGYGTKAGNRPIVSINEATFYREHPSKIGHDAVTNPAIFPDLTFLLASDTKSPKHWAVIGSSNAGKTTLLEVLRGQHLCFPSTARSFPFLCSDAANPQHRSPARVIHYVGFDSERAGVGKSGTRGAYLSARYESRREDTDFTVMDYLTGNTDLNPLGEKGGREVNKENLAKVIGDLQLAALKDMPMRNLSNGQTRRAKIARALLGEPMVLLLDEPFSMV